MRLYGKHIRMLSLFLVVFLGLNPAAVFCLAYCNFHVQVTTAAHCPLKKKSADCHQSKKTTTAPQNANAFDTESAKGCVMPVNVIAAPVEGKFGIAVDVAVVPAVEQVEFAPVQLIRSRQVPKSYYRPPPNDLSFERIRNQVFRI